MEHVDILNLLSEIPEKKWESVISICYNHINIRLHGKTNTGAHCEQRLGIKAVDFYLYESYKAIYTGTWKWKYEKYSIEQQLIRIIDSKISEEVRKYKIEIVRNQETVLVGNEQLALFIENEDEETDDEAYLKKLSTALMMACEKNEKYKRFMQLNQEGLNYNDICKKMNCTKKEAYQMKETIARRAIKILRSL